MTAPSGDGLEDALRQAGFRGELRSECPLAPFTTWRIGGPAQLLATPADRDDLVLALSWASGRGTDWRLLGNGSNLLVRDEGVRGLVLRVRKVLEQIDHDGKRLVAGAGALFPVVARRAAALGLAGIEFGAGIPGTIGGAIVMNAGWHEFEIGNVVEWVEFLCADGQLQRHDRAACEFGYRHSRFRGLRPSKNSPASFRRLKRATRPMSSERWAARPAGRICPPSAPRIDGLTACCDRKNSLP